LRVLLIKLFEIVCLRLVVLEIGFSRREFFGVMGPIRLVIRRRRGLQETLQLLTLPLLLFDLVF
jgi:hypothetical protein